MPKREGAGRKAKLHLIPALLDALVATPQMTTACARVGMSVNTALRYLVRSRMGDPELQEIEWYGVSAPFHIHATQNARALAAVQIEQAAMERALNGVEIDVFYQGQRQYERVRKAEFADDTDDELTALGYTLDEIYEMKPVKQWLKPSDALVLKMLESWGGKRYRPHQEIDVNYGGVLRLQRPEEAQPKQIEAKEVFEADAAEQVEQRGGYLAVTRPAASSEEMDAMVERGEFAAKPVAFVDANGQRTELMATPVVVEPTAQPDYARTSSKTQRRNEAPQQRVADGQERIGYGKPLPGGFRTA